MLDNAGKNIKKVSKVRRKIKNMMNKIIRENGTVSSRETLDQIIQVCLICEIEIQEAINVLNGTEQERKDAIKSILCGYINE